MNQNETPTDPCLPPTQHPAIPPLPPVNQLAWREYCNTLDELNAAVRLLCTAGPLTRDRLIAKVRRAGDCLAALSRSL